jgi:diguanylate cyclase (GGDEF)-like protein
VVVLSTRDGRSAQRMTDSASQDEELLYAWRSARAGKRSSRPPVILVVNEQEWAARSLDSLLAPNGYAVLRAYTGQQALELASTAQFDAVVIDTQTPDMDAFELCKLLRTYALIGVSTPIVITSSHAGGRLERLSALSAGAWEYCTHPIDAEVLLLKLQTFIECKRQADDLREHLLIDPLTGLYSMKGLARRAREIGAEAFRHRHSLACVAFSPSSDSLEGVDQYGGPTSTLIVQHLGSVCRGIGRISDAFGRLGPIEFAVVAPATDDEGAVRLVSRLAKAVEEHPIVLRGSTRTLRLRAGYCAVGDYTNSQIDAVDMLVRATGALHELRDGPADVMIRGSGAS